MRFYDLASAVFWFIFSVAVFTQSIRMGVGTLGNPGMGFMACGASGLMGLLSVVLFVKSFMNQKGVEQPVHPFSGLLLGRVIGFVIALIIYIFALPFAGYLLCTFCLLICLLVMVGRRKWWLLMIFPGLTTLVSYYIFAKLFQCPFPAGILSF